LRNNAERARSRRARKQPEELPVEQDARRFGHNGGQGRLAGHQRFATQIIAIQFDQIEGAQEHAVIVVAVSKAPEVWDAGFVASNRLAVDDDRARTQ